MDERHGRAQQFSGCSRGFRYCVDDTGIGDLTHRFRNAGYADPCRDQVQVRQHAAHFGDHLWLEAAQTAGLHDICIDAGCSMATHQDEILILERSDRDLANSIA
jgi:hypothetical protein